MKKLVEHGKIWLIASVISLSSFVYMQLDTQVVEQKQVNLDLSKVEVLDNEDKEYENTLINLDLVKKIISVFVDVIKLNN